jgi:hypothetical protein
VLALEGKPRPAGAPPAPVRAPLPLHAAGLLGRLLGRGPPYRDVPQFQADLAAVADRPAEVTRPRRLAHLAVLALLLSFGLCAGLLPAPSMSDMPVAGADAEAARLEDLAEAVRTAGTDQAVTALTPQPAVQAAAVRSLQLDLDAADELGRRAEAARRERDARIQAQSWGGQAFVRGFVLPEEEQLRALHRRKAAEEWEEERRRAEEQNSKLDRGYLGKPPPPSWPFPSWEQARRQQAREEAAKGPAIDFRAQAGDVPAQQTIWAAVWPALWVLWAFAARGGFSYRMSGLALVRRSGRPALRIQCAWRALLVWLPVVGLMAAGAWLEAAYWSAWAGGGAPDWLLALANAAWWAALALFPLYVFLALLSPQRAWHDVLAGTYLVPR